MLTAEKWFCRAMRARWTRKVNGVDVVDVACTVTEPDERWVKSAEGEKACVYLSEFEPVTKVGDRQARRVTAGGEGKPDAVSRLIGSVEMVLEVRINTGGKRVRLNTLAAEFCQAFQLGYTFGPEEEERRFQISGRLRGARVRSERGGPVMTEMLFRVPVKGPFEETGEEYPVETVEQETVVG